MMEKLEQTKEFIEEVERLRNETYSLHNALNTVNFTDFPNLKIFLHDAFKNNEQLNQDQITFAKIWAGEIELVEKKSKYVIYQVNENSKTGKVHYTIYAMAEESRFYPRRVNTDRVPDRNASPDELFDQDFAFAMRDTSKFKIEEVVE